MAERRAFKSPKTGGMYSSGTTTSTFIMGSRRTAFAGSMAFKEACARDFESHFVRVDIVVAAVDENHGDIHHREARENAIVERFADARFDGRNEFAGNR